MSKLTSVSANDDRIHSRLRQCVVARFPATIGVDLTVTKETPVLDGMVDAVGISFSAGRDEILRLAALADARDAVLEGDLALSGSGNLHP